MSYQALDEKKLAEQKKAQEDDAVNAIFAAIAKNDYLATALNTKDNKVGIEKRIRSKLQKEFPDQKGLNIIVGKIAAYVPTSIGVTADLLLLQVWKINSISIAASRRRPIASESVSRPSSVPVTDDEKEQATQILLKRAEKRNMGSVTPPPLQSASSSSTRPRASSLSESSYQREESPKKEEALPSAHAKRVLQEITRVSDASWYSSVQSSLPKLKAELAFAIEIAERNSKDKQVAKQLFDAVDAAEKELTRVYQAHHRDTGSLAGFEMQHGSGSGVPQWIKHPTAKERNSPGTHTC